MHQTNLGRNLRDARRFAEKSQQDLADHLGCVRTTLSSYERGYTEPSIERLKEISSYLAVSVEQLIGDAPLHPSHQISIPEPQDSRLEPEKIRAALNTLRWEDTGKRRCGQIAAQVKETILAALEKVLKESERGTEHVK